jgi:hypothetical protein
MAKYSMKKGGKEVGPASIYAEPHTMDGKKMDAKSATKDAVVKPGNGVDKFNMSVGGISKGNYEPVNKNGEMKIRGTGAATKGTKARGPMA